MKLLATNTNNTGEHHGTKQPINKNVRNKVLR